MLEIVKTEEVIHLRERIGELPILIIVHDTTLNDIYGKKNFSPFRKSALFIESYFLSRNLIRGFQDDRRDCITTKQVFSTLKIDEYNTWVAIQNWLKKDDFTEKLDMNERSSVYATAHHLGLKRGKSIILAVNDEQINEKIIKVYKESGRGWVKHSSDLPFIIKNTDELIEQLKIVDKEFINWFSSTYNK